MQLSTTNEDRLARRAEALALDPYSPMTPTPSHTDSGESPLGLAPYSPMVSTEPHLEKGLNS